MIAATGKRKRDLSLGKDLSENFGERVQAFSPDGVGLIELSNNLIMFPDEELVAEIKARCILAYRRELARCLAEHYARLAAE